MNINLVLDNLEEIFNSDNKVLIALKHIEDNTSLDDGLVSIYVFGVAGYFESVKYMIRKFSDEYIASCRFTRNTKFLSFVGDRDLLEFLWDFIKTAPLSDDDKQEITREVSIVSGLNTTIKDGPDYNVKKDKLDFLGEQPEFKQLLRSGEFFFLNNELRTIKARENEVSVPLCIIRKLLEISDASIEDIDEDIREFVESKLNLLRAKRVSE